MTVFLAVSVLLLPASAFGQEIDDPLKKRLLLFTHYVATTAHTYTPETAAAIPDKIVRFTVGSDKTSLRSFLEEHAAYIVKEGLTSTFTPSTQSFTVTPSVGEVSGFRTTLSGKRSVSLMFDDAPARKNDIVRVRLHITPTEHTPDNPFGLHLTRYTEKVLK